MEQHLGLLLRFAGEVSDGRRGEDELYVWWGKVRSPNRQGPQANADAIRAIAAVLDGLAEDDAERSEVQLYLTDYRSLYVADVIEIVQGDLPADEAEHAPAYYAAERLACDFWFRLADIRRLVANDLPGVIAELRQLRNTGYADRPVSLYGGMVDLPLIVTRPDGRRFFVDRESRIGDTLWAEFDATHASAVAALDRELRFNLMGEAAWSALELDARAFVATAEKLYREHRDDPSFDFAPIVMGLAKAMETQVNATLTTVLPLIEPRDRLANLDGRTVDLLDVRALTLGQLARAIGGERALNAALTSALEHGAWFTGSLPAVLDDLAGVRNAAAHSQRIERRVAARWRDRLLGVGCTGDLVELARVRPKRPRVSV
jgi:hypothetical protein